MVWTLSSRKIVIATEWQSAEWVTRPQASIARLLEKRPSYAPLQVSNHAACRGLGGARSALDNIPENEHEHMQERPISDFAIGVSSKTSRHGPSTPSHHPLAPRQLSHRSPTSNPGPSKSSGQ
jgi:hypothetical protein